jgi:hypothetical protein
MGPGTKSDAKPMDRLKLLVDQTLSEFDVDVLWNVRTDLDTISQAKVLARQIAKHGGLKGMQRADDIERELLSIGETPWR